LIVWFALYRASPQPNVIDYAWFKDAWGGKLLAEHGDEWPAVFAGWAQRLVQAHEGGDRTAVSKFMHDEALRCFAEEVALTLP
jgi:hypothetical protein